MFKCEAEKQFIQEQLPNRTTKRYLKGRTLGKGGFAQCYELVSEQTGKHYAAKVITKESLAKGKAKEKLQSEIVIHKNLRHKHIVKFQHFFEDHDYVYILLELCTHNTLNELLKRRKVLTEPQVKYYIWQLLQAILYTHQHKVIHRDLKLGNLFLDEHLNVKVGDFGLATTISHHNQKRKTVCGTPNYIAPQILQSKRGHSYQVDSWSIGVIVYALLFGRPPFETNEVKLTYDRIKKCQYTFPKSRVSDGAKDFIKRMLVLNPAQRATIQELIEDQYLSSGIPKHLPLSSLACPPSPSLLQQMIFQPKASHRNQHTNNDQSIQGANSRRTSKQSIKQAIRNKYSSTIQRPETTRNAVRSKKEDRSHGSITRHTSSALLTKKKIVCCLREEQQLQLIQWFQQQPKFGFFYVLSSQKIGMYFNDHTNMTSTSKLDRFTYIGFDKQSTDQFAAGEEKQYLQKKVKILTHFGKLYCEKTPIHKTKDIKNNVYLLKFTIHSNYTLFLLSNNIQQAKYKDGMDLVFDNSKVHVIRNGKKNTFKAISIDGQNQEIRQRYHHVSNHLKKMRKTKTSVRQEKKQKEKQNSLGHSASQAKLIKKVQSKGLLQKRVSSSINLHGTFKRPLGQHAWNKQTSNNHNYKSKGHN